MKIFNKLLIFVGGVILISSCEFFETQDSSVNPNAPSVASIIKNATREQVQFLGTGVHSAMRNGFADYYRLSGIFGREIYVLATNDSRWYTEPLTGNIDNGNFLNAYYTALSSTRERAQVFLESIEGTSSVTDQEKDAVRGFCNTVKAFAMLHILNLQGSNGIRIDLDGDPLKPGPFVSSAEALNEIKRLLDLGASQLTAGGTAFPFQTPSGFSSFSTPANFRRFNRALAARVAVYRQQWTEALSVLNESFMNLTGGTLAEGATYTFNPVAPDFGNPLFQALNSTAATASFAHPTFRANIRPGDTRISKISARTTPRVLGGLTGADDGTLYPAATSPMTVINNEELILIYIEASIQNNQLANATTALNRILNAYSLPNYSGPQTQQALLDEMLYNKRYSLWFLGHRWVDLRRYNRLGDLPLDLTNHTRVDKMPRPFAEVAWDNLGR